MKLLVHCAVSDVRALIFKKVSEFTSDNVVAVELAQLEADFKSAFYYLSVLLVVVDFSPSCSFLPSRPSITSSTAF